MVVHPGELLALLGANGSGKSTLVRACLGLIPHTSGSVRLFGQSQKDFRAWNRTGYVPQRATATAGVPATVAEVVASGRFAGHRWAGWPTRADRRAVAASLELVGLAERARDAVSQLSGGQQQRVLIARALAGEPELLVMDEPVSGVDAINQDILVAVFARLIEDGSSVLLVAHDLGPMAPLVDRAVVLREGRVSFDGAPRQLPPARVTDAAHPHGLADVDRRDAAVPRPVIWQ
jgi:zinc transport system ATP-binding protein